MFIFKILNFKEGGKLMETLNQVVKKYLEENGIMLKYFAEYIGCNPSKCSLWINGQKKLNSEQIRKTHEFLQGKFLKSVDEVIKGE